MLIYLFGLIVFIRLCICCCLRLFRFVLFVFGCLFLLGCLVGCVMFALFGLFFVICFALVCVDFEFVCR